MGTLALSRRSGFRLLAHTADIGLEAFAPSREELFAVAAMGLRTLLFGDSPARAVSRREVCKEGPDLAALLVVWLNEVLYLCESAHLVPADFQVKSLNQNRLVAVMSAEPFAPDRHTVERVAKAVTYHRLVAEERDDGWYARVYIDL